LAELGGVFEVEGEALAEGEEGGFELVEAGVVGEGEEAAELWQAVHAVFPRGYELSTERAYYSHKQNLISSETAIVVTGPDLRLEGQHWKYLIPERRALVDGRVQATMALEPARTN
jgi:hypothetical protein